MASAEEFVFSSPEPTQPVPLIDLRDISRTFITGGGIEVHALQNVSLQIHPGEFVAIMGPSGSGKSTLMNVLGCLDRPTRGEYRFAGRDIESFDADGLAWLRREAFGFIFQSYNLLGATSAIENVEVPAIYAGLSQEDRFERATQLLTSLGLADRLDHRPSQLSGGQQQRVSIARALMNGGQVILADEPTGALDSQSGIEVMALLKKLAERGHTVIVITHEAAVADHTNRQIEIFDGRIVRDTGNADVENSPDARQTFSGMANESIAAASIAEVGEAVRMAFRSLRANVFRTFLTLLGILIGVASVVAMLAIGQGAQQDIIDRISSMGVNMISVYPSSRRGESAAALKQQDAFAIDLEIPNVQGTLPEITGTATLRYGNRDTSTSIIATTENLPTARNWPLARGVFFTNEDSETYTPVAVLGTTTRDELFEPGFDPLGEYVLIQKVPFQVIGVMTSKGASGFGGRDQDDVVFVPLKTGGMRLFGRQYLRSLTIAVEDPDFINETEQAVSELLLKRHGVQDFRIRNSAELLENRSESQQTFTILLGSVAAISLLVGGIGVMNIMLVSVTERTREIGIRMATGARQNDILLQFLSEAIVVSAVGGLLGVLLGVGVGYLIQSFGTSVIFSPGPMILAFSCAAATGLVFGFAPARKAARLDPVVALATE
jgi:macrolide transport system ATP-binding/permease protein